MSHGSDERRGVDAGSPAAEPRGGQFPEEHIRGVRLGHGANCSSIGSVVDTLFATATVGAAVFAAVVAALSKEPVRIAGAREPPPVAPKRLGGMP